MSGGPAKGRIVQASAEKIAEYTRPRPQSGRNRPRPPPFGTDDSRPEYPAHRSNNHGVQSGRPMTPQQAMFQFGDEDDDSSRRAAPRDALDGFITSKANPLAQKKAPPSIFGGGSGRPITTGDVFPDEGPACEQPPSVGRPTSGRRAPQQPPKPPMPDGSMGRGGTSTCWGDVSSGHAAMGASGGKQHFGMAGMGDALPAAGGAGRPAAGGAGLGRRRPSQGSSGTFVF